MAVTSTLPITFTDLYNEFGGDPNSITLSDYLRGGGLVPDTSTNSGVPTSLPVSLDDFLGASAVIPSVNFTGTFGYNANDTNTVEYGVIVRTNGDVDYTRTIVSAGGGATDEGNLGQWTDDAPISNGGDYEVYFTINGASGPTITGSPLNTWLSLGSERRVIHDTSDDSASFSVNIEIREKSQHANTDNQNYAMENNQ